MSLSGKGAEISSERLRLRALRQEDAVPLSASYSDPETMEYWSCPPLNDLEAAREFVRKDLESDARGDSLNWAIVLDRPSAVIGKCILFNYSESNRRAEVGYILNRDYWRRGLALEAMTSLIDFAFNTLGMHRLEADTDPGNTGSLGLLEKLGFSREGLFRDRWFVYGQWQDSVMLGLLKTRLGPAVYPPPSRLSVPSSNPCFQASAAAAADNASTHQGHRRRATVTASPCNTRSGRRPGAWSIRRQFPTWISSPPDRPAFNASSPLTRVFAAGSSVRSSTLPSSDSRTSAWRGATPSPSILMSQSFRACRSAAWLTARRTG